MTGKELGQHRDSQDGWSEAVPVDTAREAVGIASLHPPTGPARSILIPRDDLALAGVKVGRVEQVAGAAADQEFRVAAADRIVAAAAGGRFANLVFRQLRKREDLAP